MAIAQSHCTIQPIPTHRTDSYQHKIIHSYDDPPDTWRKCLGGDNLSYQFGLFDEAELDQGPSPGPVGPSGFRFFDRQLELAGLLDPVRRPPMRRILDLGCDWGTITERIAEHFSECPRVDAVNISERQLDYCAGRLPEHLRGRVNFYLCNGQDVDLLPDLEVPYDLVVVRGVYTHFLHDVFESSVARVVQRLSPGGIMLIADTLYKVNRTDRCACRNRKTPEYFTSILRRNGLVVRDMHVLPSNEEVIHWFHMVRLNIEQNFSPRSRSGPVREMHEMARSFTKSLAGDRASAYSIIA